MSNPLRIALITASTRPTRLGPSITTIVHNHLTKTIAASAAATKPTLSIIDLAQQDLPLFNESKIPMQVTNSDDYDRPHTRAWSKLIASYDAFVYVTPQYNASIPAPLKSALDYLYNEWKGKKALVVTYGGRGGGKAATALLDVLKSLRMLPVEETVQFSLGDVEGGYQAMGSGVLPGAAEEQWKDGLSKLEGLFGKEFL